MVTSRIGFKLFQLTIKLLIIFLIKPVTNVKSYKALASFALTLF